MLALKSLDIDLLQSEKQTLYGFLSLYSFLTIVIISIVSFLYYNFQKDLMLQQKKVIMQEYSNDLIMIIKYMHINFETQRIYPRDGRFNSAIYDSDKKLIFSTLKSNDIRLEKTSYVSGKKIHFIDEPESYYLGSKYIVIEIDDDGVWRSIVKKEITIFGLAAFIFMLTIGYFLLKLFLKPMKDALHLLDRFIKDTTHELNTPISAIVTNIEMIDPDKLDEKTLKKIKRIDIGAKTVSNIYQDLTYLTLNNKIISQNEDLDIKEIIGERVDYFKTIADAKKIRIDSNLTSDIILHMDRTKFSKLIDNLLSNAIKYNKIGGTISVILEKKSISIEDSGRGIEEAMIKRLFERYSRFDKSVGGFGIGLNIVSLICKEYDINIDITSKVGIGTKVRLSW